MRANEPLTKESDVADELPRSRPTCTPPDTRPHG
jgi:hypothetical protein